MICGWCLNRDPCPPNGTIAGEAAAGIQMAGQGVLHLDASEGGRDTMRVYWVPNGWLRLGFGLDGVGIAWREDSCFHLSFSGVHGV